ncbi:MAG: YcbK family protein, partial [Hyphomicrobiaceae bacterium]
IARALTNYEGIGGQAQDDAENDVGEGDSINASEALDFSNFGRNPDDDARTVEMMMQGLDAQEAAGFDHAAFAAFINGLGLQYFQPAEFLQLGASNRPGGRCAGRNSLPPRNLWNNLARTARMLDAIRADLGSPIRILSGYRSERYNSCIGGASRSRHKTFRAIDWTCTSGSVSSWRAAARRVRARNSDFAGGIGYYPSSRFIHIDTGRSNTDWEQR